VLSYIGSLGTAQAMLPQTVLLVFVAEDMYFTVMLPSNGCLSDISDSKILKFLEFSRTPHCSLLMAAYLE
jgi:hypothetical protein